MKKLLVFVILLNISCNGTGQQKRNTGTDNFDEAYRVVRSYGDSLKFKPKKKLYQTYLTINEDTVLLSTQEYQLLEAERDTIINKSLQTEKTLTLSDSVFIIKYSGEFFVIKERDKKYSLVDKITYETETFYDDFGEAHVAYFPASEIEIQPFRDNQYIVIYSHEGIFKVGVFEITEKSVSKKFLSKGCLIYDEWSHFDFITIKNGKIRVNYLTVWDGEEIGQVELQYENGEYSLDLNQCE